MARSLPLSKRLWVVKLDFDGDEGQVLINRDELRGVTSALRRARRVRVSFEKSGGSPALLLRDLTN